MCDICVVGGLCILIAGSISLFTEASVTAGVVMPKLQQRERSNITVVYRLSLPLKLAHGSVWCCAKCPR